MFKSVWQQALTGLHSSSDKKALDKATDLAATNLVARISLTVDASWLILRHSKAFAEIHYLREVKK